MDNIDILIIGAGAAGLMAARTLAKAGKKITVLEARERCGGRIHTLKHGLFFTSAELGAEFVHGDLPVTLNLLNEAGITYTEAGGELWYYKNGNFIKEEEQIAGWDLLMAKLGELKQDTTMEAFLQKEFPGDKFEELKNSVRKYVNGYDTADTHKANAFALRKEWQSEDNDAQHRIKGGYGAIINYLAEECKTAGGYIYLNSIVKKIYWQRGKIEVITEDGIVYEAGRVLVALPLGVLQADRNERETISFIPPVPEQKNALADMGFGAIIKILLEFDLPFWEDKETEALAGKSLMNMGFLLSDEEIPTWWTQAPEHSPVLTGWLGGPAAVEKKYMTDDDILKLSLQSLCNIFKRDPRELKNKLLTSRITNWTNDPFTCGSYAYDTIVALASRKLLNSPVNNTIFFAGEYLYDGPAMGTVEAALTSGEETAKRILNIPFNIL